MFINYFKILSSICGCKGTNILNNVQYLKIMKFFSLFVMIIIILYSSYGGKCKFGIIFIVRIAC